MADEQDRLEVDVVVLGGGPAGENVAQYATEDSDLTAAIIEGERLGGECSYWACMPSKAMLGPISAVDQARDLPGVNGAVLDPGALRARRDAWVSQYDDAGQVSWAEGAGLQVVRGSARLDGERTVRVRSEAGERTVTARRAVVIATGSEPTIPAALAPVHPWTSRDATGVREVPASLAIVGGGVVACEAATWMAAMGCAVTMLVRGDALLRGVEPAAGRWVADALRDRGVQIRTGVQVTGAERAGAVREGVGVPHGGEVTVHTSGDDVRAAELLVAAGRTPRLAGLGLESVGLRPEDVTAGRLPGWLHAVGDASGEAALTHQGKYRARVVGAAIRAEALGEPREPEPSDVPVPHVVFTDPQVAAVGLTAAAARGAGVDVLVPEVSYNAAAGTALLRDHVAGMASLVVERATHRLLGATFVGPQAAELLHAATIAIIGAVPVETLRHAVAAYPTASELWLPLLEQLPRALRRAPA